MNHVFDREDVSSGAGQAISVVTLPGDVTQPGERIRDAMAPQAMACVFVFAGNVTDFDELAAELADAFPDCVTLACTTAGELGPTGYCEDSILALGFPRSDFAAMAQMIDGLGDIDTQGLTDSLVQTRVALAEACPEFHNGFATLLIDGVSLCEDKVAAVIAPAMGGLPLFGGSAGDATRFELTKVALNGTARSDAAVVAFLRTNYRAEVFSLNNLLPTQIRMVVTEADAEQRIVKTINAEPAAQEYARILGKDPEQIDEFTFVSHPVVVQIGDRHHVRAIKRANTEGELEFFSAIDEGMVLTLAESEDQTEHLDRELSALQKDEPASAIIGFDCVLRRIAAEQTQQTQEISRVLARHRVVGFSTYGEQFGPLHVNQTMTGVALYPPRRTPDQ